MKILLGYAIILGFLISFCNCYNFSVAVDPYHKEIYRFVKKVITDWNQKHENDINDISIINMENDTSLFHIVRKAIPKENPIFLPDCGGRGYLKHVNTRRSSIFIIISRIFGDIYQYGNQLLGCIDSDFWTPQTNVLVIPLGNVVDINDIVYPNAILKSSRTLNFIIPYIQDGRILGLYKGNSLKSKELDTFSMVTDTDVLFDDKLVDMKGFVYKTIVNQNDNRLIVTDNKLLLTEIQLMETIAKKQNAKLNVHLSNLTLTDEFKFEMTQGKIDAVLNFGYYSGLFNNTTFLKTVNTYETNGYCALIPAPYARKTFLRFVVYPFSTCVWSMLILSIAVGALVWHAFRKLCDDKMVPGYHLIYDVLSVFVQQSVNIRRGRTILRLMLQFFIFMMIVLANIYQGMMTSTLIDPRGYKKIESIQDLLLTDYKFYGDPLLLQIMNESDTNQNITNRTESLDIWLHNSEYIKQFQALMTANPNNVLIVGCGAVQELLDTQINTWTKGYDVYYQLHEKLLTYYESILLTRRSPFYEKLCELSLKIHETGIKQHWSLVLGKDDSIYQKGETDASMLGLKEMLSIFRLYLYGVTIAFAVFLIEFSKLYIRIIYHRLIKKCIRCVHKYRNRKVGPRLQRVVRDEPIRV